jgi:electron transport complex protein RnfC
LSQHIGAPAVPLVAKGERVLRGQKIAEANGFISANIHSSVSGTVKALEPRMMAGGSKAMSIVIENDEQYEEVEYQPYTGRLEDLSNEELLSRVKEAGIVGMGGAGFPTNVKLSPKEPDKIDYIIANCSECEPYLTSDYRRMMESAEKLVSGMRIVLHLFPDAKGVFGVEDNKPEAIRRLSELVANEERMEVATLKTKYPQGGERTLIYAVTGRQINSTMLPADVGCIVHNVDTLISIDRAVNEGKPLMEGMVTVTGDAIANPCNFRVHLGMMASELLEAAGGYQENPEKIIIGGAMMGRATATLDIPVHKTFSAILALTSDAVAANAPSNCIKCGRCATVCPGHIIPQKAAVAAANGDKEAFVRYNGMECCECGCCSYICPAKRHLTQTIATMRKQVLADRRKK